MTEETFRETSRHTPREASGPGRVLVTGGASGLGAAVVDAVLQAGGTPVVLDRDIRTSRRQKPSKWTSRTGRPSPRRCRKPPKRWEAWTPW